MLKKVLCGAAVVAASVVMASPAQAAFYVTISDGTNSFTVNDNNLTSVVNSGSTSCGGDVQSTSGNITVLACSIGAFQITLDGQTSNSPGGVTGSVTSQINVTWAAAATNSQLTVTTFSDGFTQPVGNPLNLTESLGVSGQAESGVKLTVASTGAGVGGGTSVSIGPDSCTGNGLSFDCAAATNSVGQFNIGSSYSLTNVATINVGSNTSGQVGFNDTTVASVPEPGSMLLLGTGLFGLAGFARRRFNLGNAR